MYLPTTLEPLKIKVDIVYCMEYTTVFITINLKLGLNHAVSL